MEHQDSVDQQVGEVGMAFPSETAGAITAEARPRPFGWLPEFPQLLSAVRQGILAVLGQGLFAGSHFLINIMLARWLPPEQYGAFALAYSCYLLFLLVYCACIYEPVIVFGAGRYKDCLREYLALVGGGSTLLLVFMSFGVVLVLLALRRFCSTDLFHCFLALAVAAPFILTSWVGRGGFYAQLRTGKVAAGGAVYCTVLTVVIAAARFAGRLSPAVGFMAMGAAGLAASCFFYLEGRRTEGGHRSTVTLKTVARDHWRYGRWAVASAAVMWFPDNIYYAVLSVRSGLEATAALRARVNLINPALHTVVALSTVFIPLLVKDRLEGGTSRMKHTITILLTSMVVGAFLYTGVLLLSRTFVLRTLYAGRYSQYAGWTFVIVALLPLTVTVSVTIAAALRAWEKPNMVFWAYVAAAVAAILFGIPLTASLSVAGAATGLLISSLVTAGATACLLRSQMRRLEHRSSEQLFGHRTC